jgi:hypothetical protein
MDVGQPRAVDDDFEGRLDSRWTRWCPGGGALAVEGSVLRLALPETRAGGYSDAQVDDYTGVRRSRYPWRPPLRMEARARFSHEAAALCGTAGFGFWNYPLTAAGGVPRLPEAVWFFAASPHSNMALVPDMAGWGWKAQIVHAQRWGALAAGLPTLAAVARARLSGHEEGAARWLQRLSGAREAPLATDARAWHDYTLEWRTREARFWVDGQLALSAPRPPRGPLGFVAWIDNQYALATPRGTLRFGTLAGAPRWLELDRLRIAEIAAD